MNYLPLTFAASLIVAGAGFWANDTPPGQLDKAVERLFVGSAANKSDDTSHWPPCCTWVDDIFKATPPGPNYTYLEQFAQMLAYSSIGQEGAFFASRASDNSFTQTNCCTMATAALAVQDSAKPDTPAWGHYVTGLRRGATPGPITGLEINIGDQVGGAVFTPYGQMSGQPAAARWSLGIDVNSGGEASSGSECTTCTALQPLTAGLLFNNASSNMRSGILFFARSIAGDDGVSGYGPAIQMARGHALEWYAADEKLHANIVSNMDAGGPVISQKFAAPGIEFDSTAPLAVDLGGGGAVKLRWGGGPFTIADKDTTQTVFSADANDQVTIGAAAKPVLTTDILVIGRLPTSCAGLPSGAIYRAAGSGLGACP